MVEIYPRLLTGAVNESRWRARHDLLFERFGTTQDATLLERAAGSEDAFDAAVSALAMSEAIGRCPPTTTRTTASRAGSGVPLPLEHPRGEA